MAEASSTAANAVAPHAPPTYEETKSGGRARKPVLDARGRTDFNLTYADLIRKTAAGALQCTRCGDLLNAEDSNKKIHFGSCCFAELTKDDQELKSVSTARGKRVRAGSASSSSPSIASMFAKAGAGSTLRARVGMRGVMLMFLCMARLPFNVCESPAVSFLVEQLGGTLATTELVSRRTMLRELPLLAGAAIQAVRNDLYTSLHAAQGFSATAALPVMFSVTLDAWSNVAQKSYASVTLHYVTPAMLKVARWVGFEYFPHPHDSNSVIRVLDSVLKRLGVSTFQMLGFTTDNGSNMLKSAHDTGLLHFRCWSHTHHLAIMDSFNSAFGENVISPVRALLAFFARSPARRQALAEEQRRMGFPRALMPIYSVVTRWNSTHAMLLRFLAIFAAISTMSAAKLGLTQREDKEEWTRLQSVVIQLHAALQAVSKCLTVQAKWSVFMQSSKRPTLCFARHAWTQCISAASELNDDTDAPSAANLFGGVLANDLDKRRVMYIGGGTDDDPHDRVKWLRAAEFLHPLLAFKWLDSSINIKLKKTDKAFAATKTLLDEAEAIMKLLNQVYVVTSGVVAQAGVAPGGVAASFARRTSNQEPLNDEVVLYAELVNELHAAHANDAVETYDDMGWWRQHEPKLPKFAKVFRSVAGVETSSAESERANSAAGIIWSNFRAQLGENGERQLLVYSAISDGLPVGDLYMAAVEERKKIAAAERAAKRAKMASEAAAVILDDDDDAAVLAPNLGVAAAGAGSSSSSSSSSAASSSSSSAAGAGAIAVADGDNDDDEADVQEELLDSGVLVVADNGELCPPAPAIKSSVALAASSSSSAASSSSSASAYASEPDGRLPDMAPRALQEID